MASSCAETSTSLGGLAEVGLDLLQGFALVVPHNLRPSPAHGRAAATAATVGRGRMSLWTVSRVQSCSETSKSPRSRRTTIASLPPDSG